MLLVAPERAVELLGYDRLVAALRAHGLDVRVAAQLHDDNRCLTLHHMLAGDADAAAAIARSADSARTVPMNMLLSGAIAAVRHGLPAALLKEGYARWIEGRDADPDMPGGLVVPTALAAALGVGTAMHDDGVSVLRAGGPLPDLLATVLHRIARDAAGA